MSIMPDKVLRLAIVSEVVGIVLLAATLFTTVPILLTILLPLGTALAAAGILGWAVLVLRTVL